MDAIDIVREHIQRKCKLYFDDPDTVSGHIENERAVTNDYRGRALYELIQNAVDRAESNIWITLNEEKLSLVVANDGEPFSAVARQGEPRSDLAALCSLHTSNKKAGESIGNKGVGFKSVWEFCRSVQIKTRNEQGGECWGVRLRWPFMAEALDSWVDQHSVTAISQAMSESTLEKKHRGKAPSFYFPEYLDNPVWSEDGSVTAIELENIDKPDFDHLRQKLESLLRETLVFIGDIRRERAPIQLTVNIDNLRNESRGLYTADSEWLRIDIDTQPHIEMLNVYQKELGFDLARNPRLSLAFPLATGVVEGKFHSYLPTEMGTGSPLHIQGDFYLSESRKSIDFTNNPYNKHLLEIAVDVLVESLDQNTSGIAALPYALDLLKANSSPVAQLLINRIKGKGSRLANIIANILKFRVKPTLGFYNKIYKVIAYYTPLKTVHYIDDYRRQILAPYFSSFSRDELYLVPTDVESLPESNDDPVVLKACALSVPEKGVVDTRLFCRRSTDLMQNIDVPGLVVTNWRFPNDYELADNLKALSVWADYEAGAVLRAIVKTQNEAVDNVAKAELLQAARAIYSPRETVSRMQWRFFSSDEVYPSQRLLIPVLNDNGWAEVRNSFVSDRHPGLLDLLDENSVFPIDANRCESLLGSSYLSILKYWGVWDVVPLLSAKGGRIWEMPIKCFPKGVAALSLFADSFLSWDNVTDKSKLNVILQQISETEWLSVSAGSDGYVCPASAYLGVPNGNIGGYYLINPDGLTEKERHFLVTLGVASVESTNNLEKMVVTAESMVANCAHPRQIKGAFLSAYRQLLKRINRILFETKGVPDKALMNRLPLLYETANMKVRGIASGIENVWYVSGSHRSTRSKMDGEDVLWWLANAEMGTLANHLDRVKTLTAETNVSILSNTKPDNALRELLEREYLPVLMSFSCYGDIPGLIDIDESVIQRRWQSLSIFTVENALLHESIGAVGQPVKINQTHISESLLLWEPLRVDSKKKLYLYVIPEYDIDNIGFKKRLCLWFAEEVFRRRELVRDFEKLILKDITLDELGVTEIVLNDVREVIHDWFPDEKQSLLMNELSAILGFEVNANNWRDLSIYAKAGITFDSLLQAVSADIKPYIEPMNPVERNEDALLAFVDSHVSNLAALPDFCEFKDDDWLKMLYEDMDKFSFSFDPLEWMLIKTCLSREDFDALKGKIAYQLRELQKNPEALTVNQAVPNEGGVTFRASTNPVASTGQGIRSLIATRDQAERIQAQQANATAGKNVEDQLALLCAKDVINVLSDEFKQYFIGLLSGEYQRIGLFKARGIPEERRIHLENLLKIDVSVHTEKSWKELIHIGDIADGTGYDVISFSPERKQLLLIEVKSSRGNDTRIFLSENERMAALKYVSNDFVEENPLLLWRMYLVKESGHYDITENIASLLRDHQQSYLPNDNLAPESWVLTGIEVQ